MKCLFAMAVGALFLAGSATPATSSVTVLGKSAARSCYEAARAGRSGREQLEACNLAFEEGLVTRDKVATYVNRGIIHALRKDHQSALRDFNAAIALDPNEPEAFLNKGILMLQFDGREMEVVELANTALAKQTRKQALAYYTRAIAHEGTGNLQAAYRDYRQAAALAPEWQLPAEELKRFVVRSRG